MRLASAAPPGSKDAPLTLTKHASNTHAGGHVASPADHVAQRVSRASAANASRRGDEVDAYLDPDARPDRNGRNGRNGRDSSTIQYQPNYLSAATSADDYGADSPNSYARSDGRYGRDGYGRDGYDCDGYLMSDRFDGGTSSARHLPTQLQLRALLLKRGLCFWRDKAAFLMQQLLPVALAVR